MKTKAVRMYGKEDFRLEEFELSELKEDEILGEVISDSICMSTYKAGKQGSAHKRVPEDIAEHPVIIGHEFCGIIRQVGDKWKEKYSPGEHFVIQPNLGYADGRAPGYTYTEVGGDATFVIIHREVIENDCLLKFKGKTFFEGSLVEPLCCVCGGFNAQHHYKTSTSYEFEMGIKEGGNMALIAATGPMGFLAIDLAIHGERRPKRVVVIGRNEQKLAMAKRLYTIEDAKQHDVELIYYNTHGDNYFSKEVKNQMNGEGFDDVFVFAPVSELVTEAEKMLRRDGCLNFFAGPIDQKFLVMINFYNVHYNALHVVGTSGGTATDMKQAIKLIEDGVVNVAKIATHILGLDQAAEKTLHLPEYNGGKKVVYTHKRYPLTEIASIMEIKDPIHEKLGEILKKNDGIWCKEAEDYFLQTIENI